MWKIRKLTTTALFNFPTCQVIMHACKYFLHYVLIYLFSPLLPYYFCMYNEYFCEVFFHKQTFSIENRVLQNKTIIITMTVFMLKLLPSLHCFNYFFLCLEGSWCCCCLITDDGSIDFDQLNFSYSYIFHFNFMPEVLKRFFFL